MKSILLTMLVVLGATIPSTGCYVRTRHHNASIVTRDCGHHHHWNGRRCVRDYHR